MVCQKFDTTTFWGLTHRALGVLLFLHGFVGVGGIPMLKWDSRAPSSGKDRNEMSEECLRKNGSILWFHTCKEEVGMGTRRFTER